MESSLKQTSLRLVFVLVIIFGLAQGALKGYQQFIFAYSHISNIDLINTVYTILNIISFIISPILLFVVMYLVGRVFNLRAKLIPTIILLFVGSYSGILIGHLIGPFLAGYTPGSNPVDDWFYYLFQIFSLEPNDAFFSSLIAFAGLAIAYIRHLKGQHT